MTIPRLKSDGFSIASAQTPSPAAGAGAGGSPTIAVAAHSTDQFGQVSITAGDTPLAGTLVTLTFANPYTIAPTAVVVSQNDAVADLGVYASASTTALTIGGITAGTQSDVYLISYIVVGGA